MRKRDRTGWMHDTFRGWIRFLPFPAAMGMVTTVTVLTAATASGTVSLTGDGLPVRAGGQLQAGSHESREQAETLLSLEFHEYDRRQPEQGDPQGLR